MTYPIFNTANAATNYGKYNFSTQTYYHPQGLFRDGSQPGPGEIYCAEALGSPNSINISRDSPTTTTRVLKIVGTYNESVAFECVRGWISLNNMRTDGGVPFRSSSLSADSSGAPLWECTLEYADPQNNTDDQYGQFCEIQMSTTGGSAHVNTSLLTQAAVSFVGEYDPINYGRLINVDNEGNSNGVEIKATTVHINVSLNWPDGVINPDYLFMLAELSPCVNSNYWFDGFAPGTLLFEGANVDRVTCTDPFDQSIYYRWKVSYSFLAEPNTVVTEPITWLFNGMNQQSVITVPKRGWDYLWRSYATAIVNGMPQNILRQINVEQMYRYVDFNCFGIPYSLFY